MLELGFGGVSANSDSASERRLGGTRVSSVSLLASCWVPAGLSLDMRWIFASFSIGFRAQSVSSHAYNRAMAIILTDKSADEFLSFLLDREDVMMRAKGDCFSKSQASISPSLIPYGLKTLRYPISILSNCRVAHPETLLFRRFECSASLPPDSFMRIDQNVLSCGPELTFVRMANHLSFAELVALGCEYCGTYVLGSSYRKTNYGLNPLTSVRRIQQYIERIPSISGISLARDAARYIVDGSASPMETALYITLCLPSVRGGYGLPKPKLNHAIRLNENAKNVYLHDYCKCDLYFERANLDLEYHGAEYHLGKTDDDNARAYALEIMGCRSLAISKAQFNDVVSLSQIVREIAKAHGKKPRKDRMLWTEARDNLRKDLRLYLSRNGRQ